MRIHFIIGAASLLLGGCQTVEQAATQNVEAVCAQGGYGLGSQYHDYCVSNLKPAAIVIEQQQRRRQFNAGIANIARGINPPQRPTITCVQMGNVTTCS